MKNSIFILLGVFVLGLSSCSEYNEVVKSDNYEKKLTVANSYFERGSVPKVVHEGKKNEKLKIKDAVILRSVTLYEQIYQRMPKTGEGELAYFRIGKAYYIAQDYYMAGYYLGMFPQRFPYSVKAEESLFLSAMCSVNNSPESSLDQTETELAINDLQQFIDRYPTSNFVDSCNNIIDDLRFKLEFKSYNDVKLYSKTEGFMAAVSGAKTFIDDYPMSIFNEDIHIELVRNSYFLAKNSIETKKVTRMKELIERYNTFATLYPTSESLKALTGYRDEMDRELNNIKS